MYDVLSVIGMLRGLRRPGGWSGVSGEDVLVGDNRYIYIQR